MINLNNLPAFNVPPTNEELDKIAFGLGTLPATAEQLNIRIRAAVHDFPGVSYWIIEMLMRYAWCFEATVQSHLLKAVIENNFINAMTRADLEHRKQLYDIALIIYNRLPASCWGRKGVIDSWLTEKKAEREKIMKEAENASQPVETG